MCIVQQVCAELVSGISNFKMSLLDTSLIDRIRST